MTITETIREIPVRTTVDVLVAGGGLGGVAAAIAAARTGARTLLVERNSFPGGVATAGMCCSIFNAYYTGDGTLGTKGIALEIADALAEATGFGKKWHQHKGHIIYDVEEAKQVLDKMMRDAGADILYESVISSAIVEDGVLKGVVVESKGGREAILADVTVDATGDADVAALAGAKLFTDPLKIPTSFVFRIGNVDVDALVNYYIEHPDQYPEYMDVDWSFEEALAQYRETGTFLFPHGGAMQMEIFRQAIEGGELPDRVGLHDTLNACQMHAIRDRRIIHIITGFARIKELDIGDISRSIADGRKMAFVMTEFFRRHLPGFADSFVIATADDLGIRISRWIDGEFTFTGDMYQASTRFPDAVGKSVPVQGKVKHKGVGAWSSQVLGNDVFDVPYRCMVPTGVEGLLMGAGRSLSADNPALLRLMVYTMVTGQGAGAAAAVAARDGTPVKEVNITKVQDILRQQGVDL